MIKSGLAALAMVLAATTSVWAEPIEGTWLRPSTGTLVTYAKNGDSYCGTVVTGEFKGQSIGCMSGTNGKYKGKVVALDEGKTYNGKASVSGNVMKLEGCVLVVCRGENWQRQ